MQPFKWDDKRKLDRGKVLNYEELEAGRQFGRYLDVDGDGIPFRTYPGAHPQKGAYFTRGTTKDRFARYSEEGPDYIENMERLLRKFDTAKTLVPAPVVRNSAQKSSLGVIYYGSTAPAMHEAAGQLAADGVHFDLMRVRGFPFGREISDFIEAHERIFIVEQNRDAQLRTLIQVEIGVDPARLTPILHYDGNPITARFIRKAIGDAVNSLAASGKVKVTS